MSLFEVPFPYRGAVRQRNIRAHKAEVFVKEYRYPPDPANMTTAMCVQTDLRGYQFSPGTPLSQLDILNLVAPLITHHLSRSHGAPRL